MLWIQLKHKLNSIYFQFNLYHLDLIVHLQGQVSQYPVQQCFHLFFTIGGQTGCCTGALSELSQMCYVHK